MAIPWTHAQITTWQNYSSDIGPLEKEKKRSVQKNVATYSGKGGFQSGVAVMEKGACRSATQEVMESECGGLMHHSGEGEDVQGSCNSPGP